MAIRVICPGCMTSFEVGDQFAGKKGPCPKCGHIIEIPKEKLVVHAPEDITSGGKTVKAGTTARPILQNRFIFTGKQVLWSVLGVVAAAVLAFLIGRIGSTVLSGIVGAIGVFAVAFPIARFGYMLIRDDDDLEMFLGNELSKKSLWTSLVFGGSWLLLEVFLAFLGEQGPLATLFLVPIAIVGSFGALIFFDCNFGRALLVYCLFLVAAVVGRGLAVQPNGWIWQNGRDAFAFAPKRPVGDVRKPEAKPEENAENTADVEENGGDRSNEADAEDGAVASPAETKKPKITKEPPKANLNRRR